ncbi:MAG: VWA-like domain-containing protein, partial [Pseudomonadota bacterium]|nr:VWA-like domain-containing protein [Pseudomonadota bacterium]
KSILDKIKELFGSKNEQSENKDENKSPVTNKRPKIKKNQSKKDASDTSSVEGRSKGQESEWEKTFEEKNRQERQKRAIQIRRCLEQQKSKVLKEMSESRQGSLGPVGNSKEVENWKKLLKKTVEEETDRWSYRRSGADNDYMARVEELEDEDKAETEVMLDVSGSVDEEMLKEFLRQLKPILKNSKLKVGCFDDRFYGFKEIKNNRDIDNFDVPGGGGTNIDLAVRAFSKKKEVNKIVFTDGYSHRMPKNDLKDVNVIWLIYDNDNFQPVCGKVIYVSQKQNGQCFMNRIASRQGGR